MVYVVVPGSLEHEGTQFTQQLLLCFTLFLSGDPLGTTAAEGFKVTRVVSYPLLIACVIPL